MCIYGERSRKRDDILLEIEKYELKVKNIQSVYAQLHLLSANSLSLSSSPPLLLHSSLEELYRVGRLAVCPDLAPGEPCWSFNVVADSGLSTRHDDPPRGEG